MPFIFNILNSKYAVIIAFSITMKLFDGVKFWFVYLFIVRFNIRQNYFFKLNATYFRPGICYAIAFIFQVFLSVTLEKYPPGSDPDLSERLITIRFEQIKLRIFNVIEVFIFNSDFRGALWHDFLIPLNCSFHHRPLCF